MTIIERIEKIKELQKHKLPYEVWSTFGKIDIHGDQISFGTENDFKTIEEVKQAIEMLVNEFGGTVKWKK